MHYYTLVDLHHSLILTLALILFSTSGNSQQHRYHDHDVYQLEKKKEIKLLATGTTLSLVGAYLIKKADQATIEDIQLLDKSTLWKIDQGAADNFSQTAEVTSDIILYGSFVLPFWVYLSEAAKGEKVDCLVMTLETLLLTSGMTNIAKGLSKRYRPYNYNPLAPEELKLSGGSRLSFFSGHVSNTTAFCFLTAQLLNDMHPHWKGKKYLTWTGAALLPLAIGYGRFQAGKHFPTDIITGYALGASIGLLIPRIHKSDKVAVDLGLGGLSVTVQLDR